MSSFLKLGVTLNNPNLTKLTRDESIDNHTVFLFDMARMASNPGQGNLANGATIPNTVAGGSPATVVAGTPLVFSAATHSLKKSDASFGDRIQLPDVAKLPADANSFLFTLWFTHLDQADLTGSQALAGYASNSSSQMPFAFYWYNGSYFLGCTGTAESVPTPANNTLCQFAVACDRNLGIRKVYKDGELIKSNAVSLAEFQQPAAGSLPWLFYLGGGFNNRRNMLFHRAWMDINGDGNNFDAKVAADYARNKDKFKTV